MCYLYTDRRSDESILPRVPALLTGSLPVHQLAQTFNPALSCYINRRASLVWEALGNLLLHRFSRASSSQQHKSAPNKKYYNNEDDDIYIKQNA